MNALKITFLAIACGATIGMIVPSLLMPETLSATPAPPNCKTPKTQTEMNICAGLAAKAADTRLNQVYQQLKAKISNDQALIDAENAWITFRDRDCKFSAGRYAGGSMAPMIYSNCIERVTKQRTAELEGYLKGMEGGGF